jgi:hypothetical protein
MTDSARDLWIDQPYAENTWRVRELVDGLAVELGSFATREQAMILMDQILNPKAEVGVAKEAEPQGQESEAKRPKPTWVRGVQP